MFPSQFPQIQAYPHISAQCTHTLDLYVGDLRNMMTVDGYNFVSCSTILDVIAGVSVCLYLKNGKIGIDTRNDRGDRFIELLKKYYPWRFERLPDICVGEMLWDYLRNPLVHDLGILPTTGMRVQINKSAVGLQGASELENLTPDIRLRLSSTFEKVGLTFHVNIAPLYWGLHQLLRNLFSDAIQMTQVENWYQSHA